MMHRMENSRTRHCDGDQDKLVRENFNFWHTSLESFEEAWSAHSDYFESENFAGISVSASFINKAWESHYYVLKIDLLYLWKKNNDMQTCSQIMCVHAIISNRFNWFPERFFFILHHVPNSTDSHLSVWLSLKTSSRGELSGTNMPALSSLSLAKTFAYISSFHTMSEILPYFSSDANSKFMSLTGIYPGEMFLFLFFSIRVFLLSADYTITFVHKMLTLKICKWKIISA